MVAHFFFSENVQLKPWLFGRDGRPGACRDPILLQVVVPVKTNIHRVLQSKRGIDTAKV